MLLPRASCQARRSLSAPQFDGALLQEGLGGCPWRVAVASILLCRARRRQAQPALQELLHRWPDPASLCRADPAEVADVVRSCGFHRNRTRALIRMSALWFSDAWEDLRELPGVGTYVADAVGIFCFGSDEVASNDRVLLSYAAARQKEVGDQQIQSPQPEHLHDRWA